MKKIVGVCVLSILSIGLFVFASFSWGLRAAALAFVMTSAIVGLAVIAVNLLINEPDDKA